MDPRSKKAQFRVDISELFKMIDECDSDIRGHWGITLSDNLKAQILFTMRYKSIRYDQIKKLISNSQSGKLTPNFNKGLNKLTNVLDRFVKQNMSIGEPSNFDIQQYMSENDENFYSAREALRNEAYSYIKDKPGNWSWGDYWKNY